MATVIMGCPGLKSSYQEKGLFRLLFHNKYDSDTVLPPNYVLLNLPLINLFYKLIPYSA